MNPLMPNNEFNVVSDEKSARVAIQQGTADAGMIAAMRANVEARKKALSVVIDESRMQSSFRLAQNLCELDSILTDPEVMEAVRRGIIESENPAKAYSEVAKAASEIQTRLMKQNTTTTDPTSPQNRQKSVKIAVADSSGAMMVEIGGN